jgi:putative polymerase
MYGDTFTRLSITFDALRKVNLGQILVGQVPLGRVGDSGILYMLRSVGLLGMPIAVWFYSGAFTYRRGSNVAFFIMMTVYLTITLMFGGASLSIKTASLLGYLVGLAAVSARKAEMRAPVEATS